MPVHIEILEYCVIKHFDDVVQYERELEVYESALPGVPQLLDHGRAHDLYLKIERIQGLPYLDLPHFDAATLGKAIAAFHYATYRGGNCLCHIDNQPKNILLSDHDYYFIDFSDSYRTAPEYDLSHLLLFWAEEFESRMFCRMVSSFLSAYQLKITLDDKLWESAFADSVSRFDLRRQKHKTHLGKSRNQDLNRRFLSKLEFKRLKP